MIHSVSTTAELTAAFANASGGDTIVLAPGTYGAVTLFNRTFTTDVTLTSADPNDRAVFTDTLLVSRVDGLTITGVDFDAAALAGGARDSRITLQDSDNINLRDVTVEGHIPDATEGVDPLTADRFDAIEGFGYEVGLVVRRVDGLTMENVEFSDLRMGTVLGDVTNAQLSDLYIHDVREGLNLYDVDTVVVENSLFTSFRPWMPYGDLARDDHPDMIQYWGFNSTTGVHNLTIQDNIFYQPDGFLPTQTIFGHMDSAPAGVSASNFTVTGNTIVNCQYHGITLWDVQGARIADNIVVPTLDSIDYPGGNDRPHLAVYGSSDVIIEGNSVLPYWNGELTELNASQQAGWNVTIGNNTVLAFDPADPLFWRPVTQSATQAAQARVAEFEGVAVPTVYGTDGAETLWAPDAPLSYVFAGDGNDVLRDTAGNDVLWGQGGADKFTLDMRVDAGPQQDVLADVNFAAGDRLQVLTGQAGAFFDDPTDGNDLQIYSNGATLFIDSVGDLEELADLGLITVVTGVTDLTLSFALDDTRSFTLSGVSADLGPQPVEVRGTDRGETLWAPVAALSHVYAGGGNDVLRDTAGNDVFWGATGADKFTLDLRNDAGPSLDVIADLAFAQGDRIQILTGQAGAFYGDPTDGNDLQVYSNGATLFIDSIADLEELARLGLMDVATVPGGVRISFDHLAPDREFDLIGIVPWDVSL